ncbi:hypothetical protein RUM44_002209 [Polyplax serrata]|uniref:Uncharacterized protein n=1 Tax=Polyplax serrata TaxID=468196 RepID=A0ABR1ANZ7_POLSC
MSTQSYYKERLGFDQTEWNDGISTPIYEANLTKSKGLWQCFIEATSAPLSFGIQHSNPINVSDTSLMTKNGSLKIFARITGIDAWERITAV